MEACHCTDVLIRNGSVDAVNGGRTGRQIQRKVHVAARANQTHTTDFFLCISGVKLWSSRAAVLQVSHVSLLIQIKWISSKDCHILHKPTSEASI